MDAIIVTQASAKEIAALVLAVQGRQSAEDIFADFAKGLHQALQDISIHAPVRGATTAL